VLRAWPTIRSETGAVNRQCSAQKLRRSAKVYLAQSEDAYDRRHDEHHQKLVHSHASPTHRAHINRNQMAALLTHLPAPENIFLVL